MRKSSLLLFGAMLGAGAATLGLETHFFASQPAQAASADDTYRQLNLFGDVFERIRADYVEKPDDAKLVEAAINGMLTSLDPHSSYMDAKSFRDMQINTEGKFGGLGIEVTMEDGLIKVISPIAEYAGRARRHPFRRHHHPDRWRAGAGPDPKPGGRQDARRGKDLGQAHYRPQGSQGAARS